MYIRAPVSPVLPDPIDARPRSVSTEWILARAGRPAFVFAHQDDETVLSGMIRRIVGDDERGTFVWWTNGDGLAPQAKMERTAYAEIRIAEATEALRRLGAGPQRKVDLESSEIENYRRFTEVARGGSAKQAALAYFDREADRMEATLTAADPDRVFVLAWQGGHPEHDLVHIMVSRAVRRLRKQTGRPIPIIQVPAYEYTILCPLRFKPWFKGDTRSIQLAPDELAAKRYVFEAYPSQRDLLDKFQRVISVLGTAGKLVGRGLTVDQFLSKEELGVVHPEMDHRHSTHRHESLNYMRDDYLGTPIRFDAMIRPIATAILG